MTMMGMDLRERNPEKPSGGSQDLQFGLIERTGRPGNKEMSQFHILSSVAKKGGIVMMQFPKFEGRRNLVFFVKNHW